MNHSALLQGQGRLGVPDAINQRRSVRDYMAEKPDAGTLHRLLAAAVHAPTANTITCSPVSPRT